MLQMIMLNRDQNNYYNERRRLIMNKIDPLKIAKIGGMVLSISSMLLTTWVSGKENEKTLAKLVDQKLNK